MLFHLCIFVLLLFSTVKINFCCARKQPELQILDHDWQNRGIFCPGSTARLKCIFPEEMEAWLWYVNGSEDLIEVKLLRKYQGHSVQHLSDAGYSTVNISKEEPYRANYSCAVLHSSDNIVSNSVEVKFQGTHVMTIILYDTTGGWHSNYYIYCLYHAILYGKLYWLIIVHCRRATW